MNDVIARGSVRHLAAVHPARKPLDPRVLTIALVGPPGAGKTAILEATARHLRSGARVAAMIINPAAERDANRISRYCPQIAAVESASPSIRGFRQAVKKIELDQTDILFVETMGGIAGAPQLGQDVTVTVLSATGGDDKAAEYARLISQSLLVILSKADLQRHVIFDRGAFRSDVRRFNPSADMLELSAFESTGMVRWLGWLDLQRQQKDPAYRPQAVSAPAEWFFG